MESVESVQKKVMLLLTKREAEVVVVGKTTAKKHNPQKHRNDYSLNAPTPSSSSAVSIISVLFRLNIQPLFFFIN